MSNLNTTKPIITRVEADLIVRHFTDEFVQEHGDGTYHLLESFTADLSSHVGRLLNPALLDEVIDLMDDVARVADFNHEDLKVNRAATVNNQPEVLDYYTGELTISINNLLDEAGFRGDRVNGSGRYAPALTPTTNHAKAA